MIFFSIGSRESLNNAREKKVTPADQHLFNYTSLVTFYEGDMLPFFYDYFDVLFSG
jgi:hypothetical protein